MRIVFLLCLTAVVAAGVPRTHRCVTGEERDGGCLPALEGEGNHKLTFVEFDNDGRLLSPAQLNQALSLITAEARRTRHHQVALFAFVHGWKTDAGTIDKVEGFEQTLAGLDASINDGLPKRDRIPLIGIYLGWPGSRTSIPLLKELTFWDRKHAAERLTGGDFNRAIGAIVKKTREANPSSSTVLIGHSFGADVLERAFATALMSRLAGPERSFEAPADLVLLLNSAANAIHSKQFIDALQQADIHVDNGPLVLSLTSDGDRVTRFVLPVGQLPGLVSGMRKRDGARSLYLRSAGNVRLLQSHEFCDSAPGCLSVLPDSYNHSPYWIARAPREVLPDHTTIWGEEFQRFLRAAVERYGLLKLGRRPRMVLRP